MIAIFSLINYNMLYTIDKLLYNQQCQGLIHKDKKIRHSNRNQRERLIEKRTKLRQKQKTSQSRRGG